MTTEKTKTAKKGGPKDETAKKQRSRDALGCRVGTRAAAINAALGSKPKTEADVVTDTGLPAARVRAHLRWVVAKGHGKKIGDSYQLKG